MVFIGILVAIIIFSIVVLVHEYGHFKSARFFGVRVEEFWLGIPPRAKKLWKDKQGTLFSLNWLPLGGFVKIAGENPNAFALYNKKWKLLSEKEIIDRIKKDKNIFDKVGEELKKREKKIILEKLKENSAPYNLSNKPAWQQSIIILAWVIMNFLLASVIFTGLFFFWVKPIGINDTIPIQTELKLIPTLEQAIENEVIIKNKWVYLYPVEGSIAEESGIQQEDLLLRINNENFDSITDVQEVISQNAGKAVSLYIKRLEECPEWWNIPDICPVVEYMETSILVWEDGRIGSYLSDNLTINHDFIHTYWLKDSIKYGFLETYGHIKLTLKALGILGKKIFFPETQTDRKEAVNQLSWPIGIVDFISDSLAWGIVFLIIIGAIISVNLGVFNLLPIPALDGGRFVFIVINGISKTITGKRIPHHIESGIHVLFFMILIALSFLIAYNDIIKIITP